MNNLKKKKNQNGDRSCEVILMETIVILIVGYFYEPKGQCSHLADQRWVGFSVFAVLICSSYLHCFFLPRHAPYKSLYLSASTQVLLPIIKTVLP